jgi:uncharacterized membrane protein YhaH (DUF805 family)
MWIVKMLFSFEWRISISDSWLYSLLNHIIFFLWIFILVEWKNFSMESENTWFFISFVLIIFVAYLWIYFALYSKRLHDLNKSGWISLTMLIPIIGYGFWLYLFIIAGFIEWTKWKNQFWEDPLDKKIEENKKVKL